MESRVTINNTALCLRQAIVKHQGGIDMATYECSKCGMAVNASCAKCDAPLVDGSLKLDDGNEVQISECPNGHGKIKSPLCCGQDMSCKV
jgi:hypothetical protein